MNTPTPLGWADQGGWSRTTWGGVVGGWAVAVLALAVPLHAQVSASTGPAGAGPPPATLPAGLTGILGIEPGMVADTEKLTSLAMDAAGAHKLADAERILSYLVNKDRENLRVLESLGHVYELQYNAAKAAVSDPNSDKLQAHYLDEAVGLYVYAAPLAMKAADPGRADRMYRSALALQPTNGEAQLGLARFLASTEQYLQAVDRFKTYLNNPSAKPDTIAEANLGLGRVYRTLKHLNLAINVLERAKDLNPENPEILVELAGAYQDNNRYDKAVDLAKQAVQKAPQDPAYRNIYAITLMGQATAGGRGRSSAAVAEAQKALQEAKGEANEAIKRAREALRSAPDDQKLLSSLNDYYGTYRKILAAQVGQDKTKVAERLELARAIQEQAGVSQTLSLHQALSVLAAGSEAARENIPYLEAMAEFQFDVYKRKDAEETSRRLLKLNPTNVVAKRILEQLGNPAQSAPSNP